MAHPEHIEYFLGRVKDRKWWQRFVVLAQSEDTPEGEQAREEYRRLLSLPARFTGFLETMAATPDHLGPIHVVRFLRLARGEWNSVVPVWETEENGKRTTREFLTRNGGRDNGAKGLIFLTDNKGKVTHFVILRAWLFATADRSVDVVGGARRPDETFADAARRETAEEIGLYPEQIKIYDLGQVWVDVCATPDKPDLFVASAPRELCPSVWDNQDIQEYTSLEVVPIKQLKKVALEAREGRLLEIIGLMTLHGWLKRNIWGHLVVKLPRQ